MGVNVAQRVGGGAGHAGGDVEHTVVHHVVLVENGVAVAGGHRLLIPTTVARSASVPLVFPTALSSPNSIP